MGPEAASAIDQVLMDSSWIIVILAISALLQFATAVFAFRLIRLTGVRTAWVLIAAGFVLMGVRRALTLTQMLSGSPAHPFDFAAEGVALFCSGLMLAGVWAISPLFRTIQEAAATLRRSRDELEILVAQRTEELRQANTRLSLELEERRIAQNELARSNAELEQFAYVASHDLQ